MLPPRISSLTGARLVVTAPQHLLSLWVSQRPAYPIRGRCAAAPERHMITCYRMAAGSITLSGMTTAVRSGSYAPAGCSRAAAHGGTESVPSPPRLHLSLVGGGRRAMAVLSAGALAIGLSAGSSGHRGTARLPGAVRSPRVASVLVAVPGSGEPASVPSAPGRSDPQVATVYWAPGQIGTYGNSGPGAVPDCAIATVADLEQIFLGSPRPLDPRPWLAEYWRLLGSAASAITRASGGLDVRTVLRAWLTQGIAGSRIMAARPIHLDAVSVEQALAGGPLYGLIDLPEPVGQHAVNYVDAADIAVRPWTDVTPASGYVGSGPHAVAIVGYSDRYLFLETWGYVQPVSWGWWTAHSSAAWSIVR